MFQKAQTNFFILVTSVRNVRQRRIMNRFTVCVASLTMILSKSLQM